MNRGIKICDRHDDYQVPLVWTFAFSGCEYWCPYCGNNGGMFGTGVEVDETPELKERLEKYKKYSQDYLHAMGILVCSATTWKGQRVQPDELPDEEKARLRQIRENWQYGIKASQIT